LIIRFIIVLLIATFVTASDWRVEVRPKPNNTTLAGFVIDESSRLPIQWASVQIRGGTKGDATLKNGSFMIRGVEAGSHKLIVMMMGYEPRTIDVQVLQDSITTLVVPLTRDKQ
jgi:hypothetical protein